MTTQTHRIGACLFFIVGLLLWLSLSTINERDESLFDYSSSGAFLIKCTMWGCFFMSLLNAVYLLKKSKNE